MRKKHSDILAVVPAYNESGAIVRLIEEIQNVSPAVDVVVINDGSSDNTAEVAEQAGVQVISLPFNLGIGGAVQTGFKFAANHGYRMAIQVDGDGQHPPEQIPLLLQKMEEPGIDVVIGSRFLERKGYQTSRIRHLGVGVFVFVNSLLLRKKITDNTSGFRAYNRRAICFLAENYPYDYPEPESVVLLERNGFRIAEIPVEMRERAHGESSIGALSAAYYMIKVTLAIIMNMFKEPVKKRSCHDG